MCSFASVEVYASSILKVQSPNHEKFPTGTTTYFQNPNYSMIETLDPEGQLSLEHLLRFQVRSGFKQTNSVCTPLNLKPQAQQPQTLEPTPLTPNLKPYILNPIIPKPCTRGPSHACRFRKPSCRGTHTSAT